MDAADYFDEIDQFVKTYKLKIEDEKKEIAECQKKLSKLVNAFSQKASSSSVINSLFKDEEPNGFVFSKHEEKRKQLAEQRRAEYNAYLEKKEAERLSKRRVNGVKRDVSPKSILDSVDYERVLAKRKEEEARFRNLNIADILHHSEPILNGDSKKLDTPTTSYVSPRNRSNSVSMPTDSLSKAPLVSHEVNNKHAELEEKNGIEALSKENIKLLEERIAKQLEEQRRQMLLQFENELRKNNEIQEEIQSLKSSSSVKSSPRRRTAKSEDFLNFGRTAKSEDFPNFGRTAKSEDFPNFGRTGGGGEPVRDSYGNLLAMRGQGRKDSTDYGSIMSFPSMQQQPVKDKMALYREELQKQIEEKKRLEALERAKEREQEEKFAQRIEEQRLKMLQEYENEMKNNKAKEKFQRQQERIRMFEEFQKKDAEARRKKVPEVKKPPSPVPEKVQPPPVVQERSNSPPIPAVRTKVLLEKAVEAVPKVVKPETTFSSLAELRRKIMEEQRKTQNNIKKSYEVMNRRTVQQISDDEEEDDLLKTSTDSYRNTS